MRAALVIPALDEAAVIGGLVARVPRDGVAEVIVVDNGSTDGTAAVARRAGAQVVTEPRRGYGAACWAGVSALSPGTEVVVFMDGDGSQDPEELPRVLEPLAEDRADLVMGIRRFDGGHPAHARFGTWLVARLVAWRYGVRLRDLGPFRAIRIDLLQSLHLADRGFGWPVEMVVKTAACGGRIVEVEVAHRRRLGGHSKVSGTFRGSLRAAFAFLRVALRAHPHWALTRPGSESEARLASGCGSQSNAAADPPPSGCPR